MSRPIASARIERALEEKLRFQGRSVLAAAAYILIYVLLDGLSYIAMCPCHGARALLQHPIPRLHWVK